MKRLSFLLMILVWTSAGRASADEESIRELVEGNRAFAFDLYRQVAGDGKNVFLSPYSISVALAMTYAGAREETGVQMAEVLQFPFGQAVLHPIFGELEQRLRDAQGEGVEWAAANSIWPHQRYEFEPDFIALVEKHYQSEVFPSDFSDGNAVARRINGWVEEKTRDKIKDLIPPGALNALTRMVLVNAVYFKGKWNHPFPEAHTADRPFYPADGSTNLVPTMHATLSASYGKVGGVQLLELAYLGDAAVMMIVLPGVDVSLASVEKAASPEALIAWEDSLTKVEVEVFLPRFSMTSEFGLSQTLQDMGMTDAFDGAKANFSGMDGLINNLYISKVVHKAFVEVNEEGTEAAAATGVIMQTSAMLPREKPVFRADRPFLFMIKDRPTGSLLFIGRMTNPAP